MKVRRLIIERFSTKPQKLLLIDGFGALYSAFMLGIVLVRFENVFGIPPEILYILALLPCLFAVYDFICFFRVKNNHGFFLRVIAIANIVYCVISLGLAYFHRSELTVWGWIYLLLEISIVLLLADVEMRTSEKSNVIQPG